MKVVMILNSDLGPGLAANTAAVLGISLGNSDPSIIGPDLYDRTRTLHPGITQQNVPVLTAGTQAMKTIFNRGRQTKALEIIGFNTIAHQSRDYDTYAEKLARAETCELEFSGLCIKGEESAVNTLTGSLKLYGR